MNAEELIAKLRKASDDYYNGQPSMPDEDFDKLRDELEKLDPGNSFLKEVGAPVVIGAWPKAKHRHIMGSQAKVKTKEEFLKMSAMNIDSSEYAALVMKRIEELREKGPKFFETAHIAKNGTVFPIELSSRVIEYQGKPAILSIARDIKERKQAELALQESEKNTGL